MKKDVARLLEDLRLLGPAGVERAVAAWREAAEGGDGARAASERREVDDPEWREAEAAIFQVARGESWMSLSQVDRESAIAAAQDSLLAILERGTLSRSDYRKLAGPMGAALPWLLSGEAEDRY